jgi:hypothetical protein
VLGTQLRHLEPANVAGEIDDLVQQGDGLVTDTHGEI